MGNFFQKIKKISLVLHFCHSNVTFIGAASILASASAFSLFNILFWMMQTKKIQPHGDRWKRKGPQDLPERLLGTPGPRGLTLRTDSWMVGVMEDVCSWALLTMNMIKVLMLSRTSTH